MMVFVHQIHWWHPQCIKYHCVPSCSPYSVEPSFLATPIIHHHSIIRGLTRLDWIDIITIPQKDGTVIHHYFLGLSYNGGLVNPQKIGYYYNKTPFFWGFTNGFTYGFTQEPVVRLRRLERGAARWRSIVRERVIKRPVSPVAATRGVEGTVGGWA